MQNVRIENVPASAGECEFVPPLDLPETWGVAWDRQLSATLAWQDAQLDETSGIFAPRAPTVAHPLAGSLAA